MQHIPIHLELFMQKSRPLIPLLSVGVGPKAWTWASTVSSYSINPIKMVKMRPQTTLLYWGT
uniref:Uncharacterized protein n=1 Tax=Anguilla anguilla TaxID=7936 RepID=A0A0E9WEI2_ANGAN